MNLLLEKYNEYKSIVNYRMIYELDNGDVIDVKIDRNNFPHLIGLHKLLDIPVIRQFNDMNNKTVSAKYIISKIKKENVLTDSVVRSSSYFTDIEDRYNNFSKNNFLSLSYTDAIIDFNPHLINSSLKSDYILFEQFNKGYNHMCIATDKFCKNYAESFFYEPSDKYISKQTIVKVNKISILDNKGNEFVNDEL